MKKIHKMFLFFLVITLVLGLSLPAYATSDTTINSSSSSESSSSNITNNDTNITSDTNTISEEEEKIESPTSSDTTTDAEETEGETKTIGGWLNSAWPILLGIALAVVYRKSGLLNKRK